MVVTLAIRSGVRGCVFEVFSCSHGGKINAKQQRWWKRIWFCASPTSKHQHDLLKSMSSSFNWGDSVSQQPPGTSLTLWITREVCHHLWLSSNCTNGAQPKYFFISVPALACHRLYLHIYISIFSMFQSTYISISLLSMTYMIFLFALLCCCRVVCELAKTHQEQSV